EEPDALRSYAPPSAAVFWESGHPRPGSDSAPGTRGHLGSFLGCDALGRCVLSRTIHGLGVSLLSAFFAAAVSGVIGVAAGVFAGYRGGRSDLAVMRMVDVLDSVPLVFVVIFVQAFLRGMRGADQAPGGQIWIFFATLG